jgi:hypothetical protein
MNIRRNILKPLAVLALLPFTACTTGVKMKKTITLDFAVRNYTDRYIFSVSLNGRSSGGAPPYGGGNSIEIDHTFDLGGPQTLTWRDAGTGVITTAKNPLYIREEDIPKGAKYSPAMCIHIYPDATAELTFSVSTVGLTTTSRGRVILKETGNE